VMSITASSLMTVFHAFLPCQRKEAFACGDGEKQAPRPHAGQGERAGRAVVLGHPIGASGCRLLVTLLYAMKDLKKKRGIPRSASAAARAIRAHLERD